MLYKEDLAGPPASLKELAMFLSAEVRVLRELTSSFLVS